VKQKRDLNTHKLLISGDADYGAKWLRLSQLLIKPPPKIFCKVICLFQRSKFKAQSKKWQINWTTMLTNIQCFILHSSCCQLKADRSFSCFKRVKTYTWGELYHRSDLTT